MLLRAWSEFVDCLRGRLVINLLGHLGVHFWLVRNISIFLPFSSLSITKLFFLSMALTWQSCTARSGLSSLLLGSPDDLQTLTFGHFPFSR